MPGHEQQTVGGWAGHLVRRLIHIGMLLVPWLFYQYGIEISAFFDLTPNGLLLVLLVLVVLLEMIRLLLGIRIFGQRQHEARQISSFAWGGVSLLLVLLFAPQAFAYPIIASCALTDPLIGELRRFQISSWTILLSSILLVVAIWLLAWHWFGTPWWWAIIMSPVIVVAERIQLNWLDDNATMQLIPLLLVLLLI